MAEQCGEILALDELHREEDLAVGLADVEHAADGRVGNLPCEPHFLEDPLALGISGRIDELQRDRRVEDQVVGAPDLAHPAAPDARDHAVTAGEHELPPQCPMLLSLKAERARIWAGGVSAARRLSLRCSGFSTNSLEAQMFTADLRTFPADDALGNERATGKTALAPERLETT